MSPIRSSTKIGLKSYLRKCALPLLKSDGRFGPNTISAKYKSHKNHLKIRQEQWRRLENIYLLDLDTKLASWTESCLPETPLDMREEEETGERISIPFPLPEDPPGYLERRPTDIMRLMPWIDNLPLMTVQRILHLTYPETEEWSFRQNDANDEDSNIFRYFSWAQRNVSAPSDTQLIEQLAEKSVVIAVQPPWILSHMDMKEFANCKSFPPYSLAGNAFPSVLKSKYRLWGKMWDVCVKAKSHWFVLTSYNQWIFGAFSPGRTAAFVSQIYEFDGSDPTIAECLTFWIASAMRFPGTCTLTKVCGELERSRRDTPATVYDILGIDPKAVPEPVHALNPVTIPETDADFPIPANSESAWDGKSIAPGSSAGVWSQLAPSVSEVESLSSHITPRRRIPDHEDVSKSIQRWFNEGAHLAKGNVVEPKPKIDIVGLAEQRILFQTKHQGEWLF